MADDRRIELHKYIHIVDDSGNSSTNSNQAMIAQLQTLSASISSLQGSVNKFESVPKTYADQVGSLKSSIGNLSKSIDDARSQKTKARSQDAKDRAQRASEKEVNDSKESSYNIGKLLLSVAGNSLSKYLALGAAYSTNLQMATPSTLGQLAVSTENAQRSTMSNAIQASAISLGFMFKGLVGGAVGFALSTPISMLTAAANASSSQILQTQQLSNVLTFGTTERSGNFNVADNSFFGRVKAASWLPWNSKHLSYDSVTGNSSSFNVSNPAVASLVNSGHGYMASTLTNYGLASQTYNNGMPSYASHALTMLAGMAADTGLDMSSITPGLSYLSMRSNKDESGKFFGLLKQTGNIGDMASLMAKVVTLTQLTSMSPDKAMQFVANTNRFGQNYANTSNSLATMGVFDKMSLNMMLSAFTPGVSVKGLDSGDAKQIALFQKDTRNNKFLRGIFQSRLGAQGEESIQYATTNKNNTSVKEVTEGEILKNIPDAVGRAMKVAISNILGASTQNATFNVSQATINMTASPAHAAHATIHQTQNKLSGS